MPAKPLPFDEEDDGCLREVVAAGVMFRFKGGSALKDHAGAADSALVVVVEDGAANRNAGLGPAWGSSDG